MSEEYLPSRFKHSNVDRFAGVLRGVVADQPEIRFKHDSVGLNANTAIHRVRDAAIAVIRGIVFLEDVDADKLRVNWPLYRVDYNPIGREVVVKRVKDLPVVGVDNIFDTLIRTNETTFETDIRAFATLYGHYRIRGRLTIVGLLDEKLKTELQTNYNVFITQTALNEHILT